MVQTPMPGSSKSNTRIALRTAENRHMDSVPNSWLFVYLSDYHVCLPPTLNTAVAPFPVGIYFGINLEVSALHIDYLAHLHLYFFVFLVVLRVSIFSLNSPEC